MLWGRHEGARWGRLLPGCEASGVGRSPTPASCPFGRAARANYSLAVGAGGADVGTCHQPHNPRSCKLALRAVGAARGRPGGLPLAWVWGVRGRALSHPRPLVRSGVWRGPTTHWLWVRGVRAWGPVTNPTERALASWLCALWGRHEGARGGRLLPACGASGDRRSPGLISPEAALYGHWMEWREFNRSGRPLSMGDTLQLTGAGSAMSLRSSAPALLHALRTPCPWDTAPYLNQARARYPGGVSELDAALRVLHPADEDLEVGKITVFVERADEAPGRPRPTNPVYDGARPTPPYAVMCESFPREFTWCPALPPATHVPRGWASPDLPPPLSRTRGAHHRGQVLWLERPGTPLLLLVIATREDPERVLGITPTHLHGAAPVPRPTLPSPALKNAGG